MAIGKSNRMVVEIVIIAVCLLVIVCVVPLYMQNRINSLYEMAHKLQDEATFLKHDVLSQELRINQLSSLEKLSAFADSSELGLYSLPQKIVPVGGAK